MKTNYSITLSAKNADNTKSIIASLSDNREIVASTVFAQIIHIASTIFTNRLMLGENNVISYIYLINDNYNNK